MSDTLTESELKKLKSIPIMKELKKLYDKNPQVQGAGRKMRMRGGSFWDDVGSWIKQAGVDIDSWAKRVKPLTALSKAAGLIGMIPGLNEVALLSPAIAGVAGFTGYGKNSMGKHTGKGKLTPQSFATHVNPVAGRRGFVSQGMGTMTQDFQSPSMKKLGVRGGSLPSHLQPFLTTRKIGGSVATAIGSIGSTQKLKF
jgi:hypothetical protein